MEHGGEVTLLHGGAALTLGLGVGEALPVGGALLRNLTAVGGYDVTEVSVAPIAGSGAGGVAGTTTSWFGPLNQTFVGSTAPVVSFAASPSGTAGAPDTAPVLSFSLLALDPVVLHCSAGRSFMGLRAASR